MPSAGFEPAIPATKLPQTYAADPIPATVLYQSLLYTPCQFQQSPSPLALTKVIITGRDRTRRWRKGAVRPPRETESRGWKHKYSK